MAMRGRSSERRLRRPTNQPGEVPPHVPPAPQSIRRVKPAAVTPAMLRVLQRTAGNAACSALLAVQRQWTAEALISIYKKSGTQKQSDLDLVIGTLVQDGYEVRSFKTAFDTWLYEEDKREEEVEVPTLRGNTDRDEKVIRVNEGLTPDEAASTLFHEVHHVRAKRREPGADLTTEEKESFRKKQHLKEEMKVRQQTEQYRIRQGLPPVKPSYRTRTGEINYAAIRKSVLASKHYNPRGRVRVDRRYEGEKKIEGFSVGK